MGALTAEELRELLDELRQAGSESAFVEAKKAAQGLPTRLWESLSAFANSPGGGVIILGVDEEAGFRAVGVPDPARIQADLASVCDRMEPPLRPLIEVHRVDGAAVVSAEVPEIDYRQKPCYYQGAGMIGGAFVRVASGNRRLTQYEIQTLLDNRGQPRHDLEPVLEKTPADLDRERVEAFLARVREHEGAPYREWDDERLLRTFRVLTEHDGRLVPTLAGYLCFGAYPQAEFPGLHLSVIRYPAAHAGEPGAIGERFADNVKVEGPLTKMLADGLAAIARNLRHRAVMRGFLREDVPEYPIEALREALANALGHRDYAALARGTPVQVRLFPDHLEIENPGGLFGPVTEDRLGEPGVQAARNAHLMRLLEDLPVARGRGVVSENRGSGITAMLLALRRAGMEPPRFEDRRTSFRVTFSNASLLDADTIEWLNRFQATPLSDAQRLALALARRSGRLTNAEYCRLNFTDSRSATRDLGELVKQGLLQQHGSRRWTYYTLTRLATADPTTGARRTRADRREDIAELRHVDAGWIRPARGDRRNDILELLRARGPMSRAELAAALGLRSPGVHRWLRVLRREGRIELTTTSPRAPNAKYRLVRGNGDSS